MTDILLEICCGSTEDAFEAERGGADRVELCSALFLGGLTPSVGSLIEAKQRLKIPVMAMNRPRPAGFCYSPVEFAVMERDTDMLLQQGADGIVFGILNEDGTLDTRRSGLVRSRIGSRQAIFHRAFDVTPDPFRTLEELIDLGITRVLTSGQRSGAPEGSALIRELIERAAGRIEVLPGAGIGLDNVKDLLAATGCTQVHMTAFTERPETSTRSNPELRFGHPSSPPESTYEVTDVDFVQRMKVKLRAILTVRSAECWATIHQHQAQALK